MYKIQILKLVLSSDNGPALLSSKEYFPCQEWYSSWWLSQDSTIVYNDNTGDDKPNIIYR